LGISLSAESDKGRCPLNLRAFEKARAKLSTMKFLQILIFKQALTLFKSFLGVWGAFFKKSPSYSLVPHRIPSHSYREKQEAD